MKLKKKLNNNFINIFSFLFILVLLVFGYSIPFDWYIFDDSFHILNNSQIKKFSLEGLLYFWTNGTSKIPITYNLWQLITAVFGTNDPAPFRIVNIVIHFLNGVLLYYFIQKLWSLLNNRTSLGEIYIPALLSTMLFLVHPVQVESVVWISSLKGLLSAFFSLISLCFYLKTIEKPNHLLKYVILMTIALGLAVLSKPSAVVLPVIFIILDVYLYKVSFKITLLKNSHLLFIGLIFTILQMAEYATDRAKVVFPFYKKAILIPSSYAKYIQLSLFPQSLNFNYGYNYDWVDEILKSNHLSLRFHLLTALVLFWVIILLTFLKKGKFKELGFSLLFFVVAVSVNTGIIYYDFLKVSAVADRYLYFPIIGFSLFFAFLANFIGSKYKKYYYCFLSFALIFLSFKSINYSKKWDKVEIADKKSVSKIETLDAVKAESRIAELLNQGEVKKAFEVFVLHQTILPEKGEVYANELLKLFANDNMKKEGIAILNIANTNLFKLDSENILSFYIKTSQNFKALSYLESIKDSMTLLDYKNTKKNILDKWFKNWIFSIKGYSLILKNYSDVKSAEDFYEKQFQKLKKLKLGDDYSDILEVIKDQTVKAIEIRSKVKSQILNQKQVDKVNNLLKSSK